MDEHPDLSRHLDGEEELERLAPDQQTEAARWQRIADALDHSRVELPADFTQRVMAEVRREPARPAARRRLGWPGAPALIRMAVGLAAVAVLMVSTMRRKEPNHQPISVAAAGLTTFTLHAPEAHSVALTGDFLAWDRGGLALKAGNSGDWVIELPLEPGVHRYVFIVDGTEWRADPDGINLPDDFGETGSTVVVPQPES